MLLSHILTCASEFRQVKAALPSNTESATWHACHRSMKGNSEAYLPSSSVVKGSSEAYLHSSSAVKGNSEAYLPSSSVWKRTEPSAEALTTRSSSVHTARQATASLCPYNTCRGRSLNTKLTGPFCFDLPTLGGGTASQMTRVVSLLPDTTVRESAPAATQVTTSLC